MATNNKDKTSPASKRGTPNASTQAHAGPMISVKVKVRVPGWRDKSGARLVAKLSCPPGWKAAMNRENLKAETKKASSSENVPSPASKQPPSLQRHENERPSRVQPLCRQAPRARRLQQSEGLPQKLQFHSYPSTKIKKPHQNKIKNTKTTQSFITSSLKFFAHQYRLRSVANYSQMKFPPLLPGWRMPE